MLRTNDALLSRQLGRNTQRFAREIGLMETPAARHPYLRQLLAVIEEARPEWAEAEHRGDLFRHLVGRLCGATVTDEEIDAAVRVRDAERALADADLSGPEADPASAPPTEPDTPAAVEPAAEVEAQDAAANGALDDEARAAAASEDAGA